MTSYILRKESSRNTAVGSHWEAKKAKREEGYKRHSVITIWKKIKKKDIYWRMIYFYKSKKDLLFYSRQEALNVEKREWWNDEMDFCCLVESDSDIKVRSNGFTNNQWEVDCGELTTQANYYLVGDWFCPLVTVLVRWQSMAYCPI